jgi:hypothetical protein
MREGRGDASIELDFILPHHAAPYLGLEQSNAIRHHEPVETLKLLFLEDELSWKFLSKTDGLEIIGLKPDPIYLRLRRPVLSEANIARPMTNSPVVGRVTRGTSPPDVLQGRRRYRDTKKTQQILSRSNAFQQAALLRGVERQLSRVSNQEKQRLANRSNPLQAYGLKTLQHDHSILQGSVTY